jgi:hypothetical protein
VVHYTEYQVPRQGFSFRHVYDAEDGLPDDRVLAIAASSGGEVWAGAARGDARVYVFSLTDRARQFRAEVEAALAPPSAQSRPAGRES